jgi:hypothetical protein
MSTDEPTNSGESTNASSDSGDASAPNLPVPPATPVPPMAPVPPPPPPAPPMGQQGPPPPAGGYLTPGQQQVYAAQFDPLAKSKMVAGILGIFLGGFGIHRFYLGFTTIGIIQICVTIVTCGLGSIWGLVEGILYLVGTNGYTTDATGRPLKE